MPKRRQRSPIRYDVETEVDGEVHRGSYEVSGGMLTVKSMWGSKSTQPGARPDVLARILLAELVREEKGKGW